MLKFMSKLDLRNRAPNVEYLPDGRQRLERVYDILNWTVFTPEEINAEIWLPWGTPDKKYPTLRLIKQDVTGQHPAGGGMRGDPTISPERHPPLLTRLFEQIDPTAETAVGNADVAIGQDGIKTVTQDWIQFSAGTAIYGVPGVTPGPAPWTTLILKDESRTDDGDLMRIKRIYISAGIISQTDTYHNYFRLNMRTIVAYNLVPQAPGGEWSLIDQEVRYPNGNPIYTYKFATGGGVIDIKQMQRDGGLRIETWTAVGTSFDSSQMQPPGILLAQDSERIDGMFRWVTSCMQNPTGGDLTTGTAFSYITKHPFRYPGRAKAYRKDFAANIDALTFTASAYDIFKSPPIEVDLDATVVFSYSTSPKLPPTSDAPYWNPDNWATYEAIWQGYNVSPHSQVEPLTGYRAINPGVQLDFTAGSAIVGGTINVSGVNTSCLGNFVYGLSHGHITVFGGPPNPENAYWTISYKIEPAFTDINGVQYFRKLQVVSLVPAQSALPV